MALTEEEEFELLSLERERAMNSSSNVPIKDKSFWGAMGAEITPEMNAAHPYLSAIAKTGQDISTIPSHFANQFLLNAPRAILKKVGVSFPETDSQVANIAAHGAGVAGAIVNPLSAVKAISGMKAGTKIIPKVLQGAKAGAIQGAAYTPTEDIVGIPQRIGQGAVGATFGAVGTVASEGIQKAVREMRKLKVPNKEIDPEGFERFQLRNVPILKRIGYKIEDIKARAKTLRESSGLAEKKELAELENLISMEQTNQKFMDEATSQSIKSNISKLQEQFKEAYETGAVDIQKKLPAFFRANGRSYKQRLDAISDDLGDNFTIGDSARIIDDTVSDMIEAGIPESSARTYVMKLSNKYGLQKFDKDGNMIEDLQPHIPANFKEFKNDISSVWDKATSEAKSGRRITKDDMAAILLQKNFGEYVAKEVPEFAKLQSEYRPVIQAMKEAGRLFKPYASDFENIQGTKLIERLANGKATIQERNLIKQISQGSQFAKGLGNITAEADNLASQIKKLENLPKSNSNSLKMEELLNKQRIAKEKLNIIVDKISNDETLSLDNMYARKRRTDILVSNKKAATELRNKALVSGAVIASLLGLGKIGVNAMRERLIR